MELVLDPLIGFLRRSKVTILLVIMAAAALALGATTSMLLETSDYSQVKSVGSLHAFRVEIYGGDIEILNDGSQYIDWGTISLGTLTNRSFYLRNISNMKAKLNLFTTGWSPKDISSYATVSWDHDRARVVNPDEVVFVTLTLCFSSSEDFFYYLLNNNVTEFDFDIDIDVSPV